MKSLPLKVVAIFLLLFSVKASSQNFTINGITGISFNESGTDYTINITDDFHAFGMTISPQSVTLDYTAATKSFEITGMVESQFDGNTIDATISFTIENQVLQTLSFDVSGNFNLNGLTLTPQSLEFQWDGTNSYYEMYGGVEGTLEGESITLSFGDSDTPGLIITSGTITTFEMSVEGSFDTKDITIQSDGLTFSYNSSDSQFEMYGSATVSFDGESLDAGLGSSSNPGLIYKSNLIEQINFDVTADFTLKGLEISPESFGFQWDNPNNQFKMFGTLKGKLEGNDINLLLGINSTPGLIISNGIIQSFTMSVSGNFTFKNITITPLDLTFSHTSNNEFKMYGTLITAFDSETIHADFGTDSSPGVLYENGVVEQMNFNVTTDFTMKGIEFNPQSFGFDYDKSNDQFEMYGTIKSKIEGNNIDLSLGDANDPGLIITNGVVDSIDMDVTAGFDFKSITFSPNDLTFIYNKSESLYEMYGSLSVAFDNESLDATFGDASSPGFKYKNNVVESINMGVTTDFTMKGIEFNPQNFGFDYDKPNDQFEMYGTIKSKIEGNTIDLSLGDSDNPGLIITNGVVDSIDMSVTADFDFKDITFSPDDLSFAYNKSDDLFEMYGNLSISFDGETMDVNLGDSGTPGLKYKSNEVQSIDFGVTADFRLKELELKPTNLTFIYKKAENKFEMYGDLKISVGNFDNDVEANLGNSSHPGFLYENSKIKQVNIAITGDFKMSGLDIRVDSLGADWDSSSGYYHVYGSASVHVDGQSISADFGTFNDPGFVFKEGHWHYFNVDLNADFKIGNLEIIAKDLDVSCCENGYFVIKGELEVKEVFSLAVTLGHDGQGGLFIDTNGSEPKFKLEDFTIDIEHANLGAIDLKQVKLEFNNDGIVESDVKVVFPEGWEIDSKMKFRDVHGKAELDEISLAYRADQIEDAIEIFEGVQLTYLEGDVKNLTRPSELEVGGTIGTIYGGGFTLDHKSATFLEMTDGVTISSKEFKINGDVNVGAYRSGTNTWHGLLGEGSIDLTAYFHHYIKARVKAKYPGDPLIEADLSVYFGSHGNFDGLLDVEFIVPHWVPFIGGKHYGSVDGAVRYKKGDLNGSFGAAWVRIKTFWHTYHEGAKYTFGSRHVSSIGSGSISSIEKTIHHDEGRSLQGSSKVFEFDVPQPAPNSMLIDIDWIGEVDNALVTVIGPEGTYELTKAVISEENAIDETPTMTYEENMTTIARDTVTTFLFKTPSAFSEEEIIHSNLVDGRYQLVVSFPGTETEIDTIQFKPKWQIPESNILVAKNSNNKFDLTIDYWTALPDSTYVSFYVNNVNSYEEGRLINHARAANYDEFGYGTETLEYTPKYFEGNTSELYFYAVIEDGVNPPFRSVISSMYDHEYDFSGTVTINDPLNDLLAEGLRVFLDLDNDGNFDTASTGGIEPFSLVNENGEFVFRDIEPGTYPVRIVLPAGYRFAGETDNFSSKTIVFDGTPLQLNFEIETY